ncbi:MAG TPA: M20/M25/M40 family metallo-hydrolase [Blastocatellia bacterium]|nr:M20/M25/M40 family metallo-hydrolase [Blastocatellia bacterium]
MLKACALFLSLVFAPGPLPAFAQERAADDINAKIRKEANDNSQIMRTMHYLTDVYGPRLTGSPNLKAAGEWAVKQMTAWGFENAHLEPWNFGHPGWANERLTAHIVSPVKEPLVCEVLAWTPGTNGTLTAQAFQMILPEHPAPPDKPGPAPGPTQEELSAYLDGVKDKVKGKIVLAGKHQTVPVSLTPPARRIDDQQAKARYDPNNPDAGRFPGRPGGPRQQEPQDPSRLTTAQVNEQVDKFLIENGALLRVNDAGREHRQIRAFNNRTFDLSKALPTVVMSNEDYGRISRILADRTAVELEFNIVNRTYPEGRTAYNTIAEIPGTDKKGEVVMLGGHLDSWHSATGATDNAIGCAVMMEAARILRSIGVKPRRTIRVALWSGEEQGLLGSQAYVKEHFGSFENPKPDFAKVVAYLNIDSGTGRARGAGVFGPPEAATVLREALAPFADLGVVGAIATKSRGLGGSDSTSFNQAGLPGIGIGQDPIEYNSATWHTNLDTYERIIEDDVKASAIAIAAAVYQLAMRDEMLPRFTKEAMPALPPPAGAPQAPRPATPQPAGTSARP